MPASLPRLDALMTAHDRAEQLLDRHQRTAILLREPYPPPAPAEAGSSYFGGLPRLPEGFDWPYLDAEVPLHFLAQIDFSELPGNDLLPDRGVLFFFAWTMTSRTGVACRGRMKLPTLQVR